MRIRGVLFSLLTIVALASAMAPAAVAQENCQEFKALTQATVVLDPQTMPPALAEHFWEFTWGGQVYATFMNTGTYLGGWFYGKDAADPFTPVGNDKTVGRGKNGVYMFAFGTHVGEVWTITDSFDIQLEQAVWTHPAGLFVGSYQASGKMANGTGRFEGATGNFTFHGDFGAWGEWGTPSWASVWNPALVGKVCWSR